jgi:adenosylhomocysteine nucleosidase
VGIVSALSIEIAPFLAHLERVRKYRGARHTVIEGELGDRLVVVIVTGPGQEAARRGAQILIDGHKPSWLVSPGFAGALANDLNRGDLVLPNEIVTEEGGRIAIDIRVTDSGPVPGPRLREGRLITVDRIIRTSREKAELQERFDADIVDMETFAVAELCASRLVRFLSVRIVSDDARKKGRCGQRPSISMRAQLS